MFQLCHTPPIHQACGSFGGCVSSGLAQESARRTMKSTDRARHFGERDALVPTFAATVYMS